MAPRALHSAPRHQDVESVAQHARGSQGMCCVVTTTFMYPSRLLFVECDPSGRIVLLSTRTHFWLAPSFFDICLRVLQKIADFGMARTVGTQVDGRSAREGNLSPRVVTLWYRAPEVLFGDPGYGVAVDLWAVGCVLGELLLHEPMLRGKTEQQQVELIALLFGAPHDGIWPGFSQLPLASTYRLPDQPCVHPHLLLSAPGWG